jgi:predicted transposase YbfD/YdcC
VDAKTNEIARVEPLSKDLDIKGAVVTADALLTQKEIARHVVQDKGADYAFTVKDNRPTLRQDIETLQLDAFPPSGHAGR